MAHRKTVVALSALTVLSIVPLFMFVGKNFLPADDQSQYNVLIRTPEGTSLAATTPIAEQVAQEIRELPGRGAYADHDGGGADRSVNNAHDLREAGRHRSARMYRSRTSCSGRARC